ncbi:hypothetical protein BDV59DRAFT_181472 [Aspergillus ambiguus]|uniref:uncharacterized protein n=1 Tax=Aspergillus ambiguus TaxID=176160 RepID=UPI003CCCA688
MTYSRRLPPRVQSDPPAGDDRLPSNGICGESFSSSGLLFRSTSTPPSGDQPSLCPRKRLPIRRKRVPVSRFSSTPAVDSGRFVPNLPDPMVGGTNHGSLPPCWSNHLLGQGPTPSYHLIDRCSGPCPNGETTHWRVSNLPPDESVPASHLPSQINHIHR